MYEVVPSEGTLDRLEILVGKERLRSSVHG